MRALGFDTSNYTTSVAEFHGVGGENCSRLLDVKPGELGLRQSDALFAHVRRLPELVDALCCKLPADTVRAVGASTRPRAVEGSYMPCFLAGESQARNLARFLDVPFYPFSHQQGHIAAALWSAGRMELMRQPHLAWHLSGGTTELLLVTPDGKNVRAEKLGGTSDISAGQLIDRTGQLLGVPFPSGKGVDALSRGCDRKDCFKVKTNALTFSLSGAENKVRQYREGGASSEETARYALLTVVHAVTSVTREALRQYPGFSVVFSGGVSGNSLLRERCREFDAAFAEPRFSTDNALGVAILTWMQEEP